MIPPETLDLMKRMMNGQDLPAHVTEYYFRARKIMDRVTGPPFDQHDLCLLIAQAEAIHELGQTKGVTYTPKEEPTDGTNWSEVEIDAPVEINWDGPKLGQFKGRKNRWQLKIAVEPSGDIVDVRSSLVKIRELQTA